MNHANIKAGLPQKCNENTKKPHLLSNTSPTQIAGSITLVRLAEQRIERFIGSVARRRVVADRIRRHVGHLLERLLKCVYFGGFFSVGTSEIID